MNWFYQKLVVSICIFLISCIDSSSSGGGSSRNIKSFKTIQELKLQCDVPNYFWSSVERVNAEDDNIYALIHLKESASGKLKSIVFDCANKLIISSSSEDNLIIDFLALGKNTFILLKSTKTKYRDPWIDSALRELVIELIEDSKIINAFQFYDKTQNNAVRYDAEGRELVSTAFFEDKTLFFASYAQSRFAKLSKLQNSFALSYVGQGGYRLAIISLKNNSDSIIYELMPNTASNSVFFDREAANIINFENEIFAILPVSPSDSVAVKKRFGIDLKFLKTSENQILLTKLNETSQARISSVIGTDASVFPVGLEVFKSNIAVLFDEISSVRSSKLMFFDLAGLMQQADVLSVPFDMASSSSIRMCNDKLWLGGAFGFKQASTGSVVKFGDAFLWSIDSEQKTFKKIIFGTDRDDSVMALDCINNELIVGGNENGPITHTGDNDANLNYQESFLGAFSF